MNKTTLKITYAAVLAALVFVVTFLTRIPVPGLSSAYINLGDTVIFISAYLLGGPVAAAVAAIGSALADLAAGAAVYIPATFVIKGLMGLGAGSIMRVRNLAFYALAAIVGGAIMTGGYFVFEAIFFDLAYALTALPLNLVQWGGSVVIALALQPAISRVYPLLWREK
ncbi:MAG: ECF transporter S component [Clostridiales bacterium]|nr:ECF transporter S component [Clostridiales bacterium]